MGKSLNLWFLFKQREKRADASSARSQGYLHRPSLINNVQSYKVPYYSLPFTNAFFLIGPLHSPQGCTIEKHSSLHLRAHSSLASLLSDP